MRAPYPPARQRTTALRLAIICLLLLIGLMVAQQATSPLRRSILTNLDEASISSGCHYSISMMAFDPPIWLQRVWDIRFGEPDKLMLHAYRNGQSVFMRMGILIQGPRCLGLF